MRSYLELPWIDKIIVSCWETCPQIPILFRTTVVCLAIAGAGIGQRFAPAERASGAVKLNHPGALKLTLCFLLLL